MNNFLGFSLRAIMDNDKLELMIITVETSTHQQIKEFIMPS